MPFEARHKLRNWKRQEILRSDERGFNAVTKPAVWVQITFKKIKSWWQKSSSFEISNLSKTMDVFSRRTYDVFLSKMVLSHPPKIDDFEIEEPWKIWKLICMASNHKSESGTNCWLTGPVKSLAALSNEGKPENIL